MQDMIGIPDLMRRGYFESEQVIRDRIRRRRLPRPMRIGGKLKWPAKQIEEWFRSGSVMWIERTNKP